MLRPYKLTAEPKKAPAVETKVPAAPPRANLTCETVLFAVEVGAFGFQHV